MLAEVLVEMLCRHARIIRVTAPIASTLSSDRGDAVGQGSFRAHRAEVRDALRDDDRRLGDADETPRRSAGRRAPPWTTTPDRRTIPRLHRATTAPPGDPEAPPECRRAPRPAGRGAPRIVSAGRGEGSRAR